MFLFNCTGKGVICRLLCMEHDKVHRYLWVWNISINKPSKKAHSHLTQRSADSAVDCINAEIGIFLSLCVNATVCRMPLCQTQLVWMSLKPTLVKAMHSCHTQWPNVCPPPESIKRPKSSYNLYPHSLLACVVVIVIVLLIMVGWS